MLCKVKSNCSKSWDCDFCEDYKEYTPIDKRIKSPRQVRVRAERKAARKTVKSSKKSKIGRSARIAGKRAERELEKLLISWGLNAKRVAMSGALKATGLVGGDDLYAGDLKLTINGKRYNIESKRHQAVEPYYKLPPIIIKDFCILLTQDQLYAHMLGSNIKLETIEDKRFKRIHSYFEQDDSDIVAMKINYRPWLFAIKLDNFHELKGVLK